MLRILGNLVTGTDDQTTQVINTVNGDVEIMPRLFALLNHQSKPVRREVCWTLSNITAGNSA